MIYKNLIELLKDRSKNDYTQIRLLRRSGNIQELSYRNIFENAIRVANGLIAKGVPQGSTVGLLQTTTAEFIYSFFGVQLAGCVPVSIYPPLKFGKIDEWLSNAKMQLNRVEAQIILTNASGLSIDLNVPFGSVDVEKLIQQNQSTVDPQVPIHKFAFLQFSSGTTGASKAVCVSHLNVLENASAIINAVHLRPEEGNCVSWLPLYHDMGLVGGFLTSVLANCQLVLIRPEEFIGSPYMWLKAISDFKANVTVAPNFAYGLCSRRITQEQIKELDLSSLEIALCGAEMIHPFTISEFVNKFKICGLKDSVLTPVYGLAEATLAVTFTSSNRPMSWRQFHSRTLQPGCTVQPDVKGILLASVGKPVQKTSIQIRDEDGNVLQNGKVGVVWVSGPGIMSEYYKNEQLTGQVKAGDWLNTGDYGFIYEEELYITGRKKEILNIRGQNYDPSIVERSLAEFSEIREGCAAAFSSNKYSSDTEELYIAAEIRKGVKLSQSQAKKLKIEIAGKISEDHQLNVKDIEFYEPDTLPRTSSGKVKRRLTKELWENKKLKKPSALFSSIQSTIALIKNRLRM